MTSIIISTGCGSAAIEGVEYHRNGVAGAGYYAVRLRFRADGRHYRALAIVFEADEHIAITADDGEISFRYEDFDKPLRTFLATPRGQAMAFPHIAERAS